MSRNLSNEDIDLIARLVQDRLEHMEEADHEDSKHPGPTWGSIERSAVIQVFAGDVEAFETLLARLKLWRKDPDPTQAVKVESIWKDRYGGCWRVDAIRGKMAVIKVAGTPIQKRCLLTTLKRDFALVS